MIKSLIPTRLTSLEGVPVWGNPNSSSFCSWFICFSTDERTWAMGDSFRCWSWPRRSAVPCNRLSTDDNGAGLMSGFSEDGGSLTRDEIGVGFDRATTNECFVLGDIVKQWNLYAYVYSPTLVRPVSVHWRTAVGWAVLSVKTKIDLLSTMIRWGEEERNRLKR